MVVDMSLGQSARSRKNQTDCETDHTKGVRTKLLEQYFVDLNRSLMEYLAKVRNRKN